MIWWPLLWISVCNLVGMLSNSLITSSLLMACHSSWVMAHNSSYVFGSLLLTLLFKTDHRFSRIFKSGDWAGQSLKRQMLRRSKKSNINCDLQQRYKKPIQNSLIILWIQYCGAPAQHFCSIAPYSPSYQYRRTSLFNSFQSILTLESLSNWSSNILPTFRI